MIKLLTQCQVKPTHGGALRNGNSDLRWQMFVDAACATQTRHVNVAGKYFSSGKLANTHHARFVVQISLFLTLFIDALWIRLNLSKRLVILPENERILSSWQHDTVCKMLLRYVQIIHSPITKPCFSTESLPAVETN